jgi:hypothetical protein
MTERASGGTDEASAARRLTLTPISFDIIIALTQVPDGLRLSALAHAIGSPVSSVQAALRVLVANGLADRDGTAPPLYRMRSSHPARDALSHLALVLPEAAHAMAIVVRANPAVELAVVDSAGFVVGIGSGASAADRARLGGGLDAIRATRRDTPQIELIDQDELERHLVVSVGLRDRVRRAVLLKGRIPRGTTARSQGSGTRSRQPIS